MSKVVETLAFKPRHHKQRSRAAEREEGLRTSHPARVARLLALAHDIEARIEAGEFRDYADVARAHGLTRARLTQVMNLLLLAPAIQEDVLDLEVLPGREPITERDLRRVLGSLVWEEQRGIWKQIRQVVSSQLSQQPRVDQRASQTKPELSRANQTKPD